MKFCSFIFAVVYHVFRIWSPTKLYFTERTSCYNEFVVNRGDGYLTTTPTGELATLKEIYFDIFATGETLDESETLPIYQTLWGCWDKTYKKQFREITELINHKEMFSSFKHEHSFAVFKLMTIIEDHSASIEEAVDFLVYLKNKKSRGIHPQLFVHSLGGADIFSKLEDVGFLTPALMDIFPSKFFSLIEASTTNENDATCFKINGKIGMSNGRENALWYYREDTQLNMHHWRWHIKFSVNSLKKIDRRGELFYFFHRELVSRERSERLSNGFIDYAVEPIIPQFDLIVNKGYNSHLKDRVSNIKWVPRPNNTQLNNKTLTPTYVKKLQEHILVWSRILNISRNGEIQTPNGLVHLKADEINILGELVEASQYSLDKNFYSIFGWHNTCHDILANVQVFENQKNTSIGVIGDVSTAVRDNIFFNIHESVHLVFVKYKENVLPPYELLAGDYPLIIQEVNAKYIDVQTIGNNHKNQLYTHWNQHDFTIEGGLDLKSKNFTVNICATQLDHKEFTYNFVLENFSQKIQNIFVHIFLAPKFYSTTYSSIQFNYSQQHEMMFYLDSYTTNIQPGINHLHRKSMDSSLTRQFPKSKKELRKMVLENKTEIYSNESTCGFPHHLLLPKGTTSGMKFDLVLFITKSEGDNTDNIPAWIHCGDLNKKYPFSKPMGYPWDRKANKQIPGNYLSEFAKNIPNMMVTEVTINHIE